jgi:hypothetical protein
METDILKTGRRSFLRGSMLGTAVLVLAVQIKTSRLSAKTIQLVPPGYEAMIAIGLAYLDQVPDEADVARLRHLLALTTELSAMSLPAPERDRLAMQQLEDFRTGQTVQIQGWILSRTEVRLCALAALESKSTIAEWHA